jgi:hypothetical protein
MPSPAKFEKLRAIGYQVVKTCGTCAHREFEIGALYGNCTRFVYRHEKHGTRNLSIFRSGRCGAWQADERVTEELRKSGFGELAE